MKTFKIVIISILSFAVIIFLVGFAINGFKFNGIFDTIDKNRRRLTITEEKPISKLIIKASTDDVEFYLASDNIFRIEYYDNIEVPIYEYNYQDGVFSFLIIKQKFPFQFFNFYNFKIKVYLPCDQLESLECHLSTGDLTINEVNLITNNISLNSTTGHIEFNNLNTNNLTLNLSTGDVEFKNSNIGKAKITLTTGQTKIYDSVINELEINSSTGDVSTYNLQADIVKIKTTTGSIKLDINNDAANYTIKAKVSTGDITITGNNIRIDSDSKKIEFGNGDKQINTEATTGSITMTFN